MALSITGYVLEPVRVGASNSPFTLTPDNYSDSTGYAGGSAFDVAYPQDESVPRTEYMVQVLQEDFTGPTGPDGANSLTDARFGLIKNEGVIQNGTQVPFPRFDYDGQIGRFKPLLGAPRALLGSLEADANTNRLVATAPTIEDLVNFPIRLAVGSTGSGTTFTVALVDDDVDFTSPAVGEAELALSTGNLNWNAADITSFEGQDVFFQRQGFFFPDESTGNVGAIGTDTLFLNPLPTTGQQPLIRFGSRSYVTVIERANDAALSVNPSVGVVEWSLTTGLLRLNSTDLVTYAGQPLIYDGATQSTFQLDTASLNTVAAPLALFPIPDEDSDVFFRIPGSRQFPETVFVDSVSLPGKSGQVQIERGTGAVQFSLPDISRYGTDSVEAVFTDHLIERGITLRLFRTPVDPGNTDGDVKDVTALYTKYGSDAATLADPMIGQPFVFLPALPLDDQPLTVRVDQGTGAFTGVLNRLDVASPPPGRGYLIDFDQGTLVYGERRENEVIDASALDYGAFQLPNFPVFTSNLLVEQETAPGSGTYTPLTINEDYLLDAPSGTVTFAQTDGTLLLESSGGSITGANTLEDTSVDFIATGTVVDDYLVVPTGSNAGVYTITARTTTEVTTAEAFPNPPESPVSYEIRRGADILADRYWREVPRLDPNLRVEKVNSLGTVSNGPRLNINATLAGISRFRLGKAGSISTSVVEVANDGAFTAPGSLPALTVEVSLDTGNLNFSQDMVDTGETVYWARELELGIEYNVQPGLGFIDFEERMLELEEVIISYVYISDDVDVDGNPVKVTVEDERGTFLVSKEVTQDHPVATSTLFFNPDGREVATVPSPAAWRGGRPQRTGEQVNFNTTNSSVTFLEDGIITDALPHGATVAPDENVYVDYYLHEALGGEKDLTVLNVPMAAVNVSIEEGETSFTIEGDRTSDFAAGLLLRVDGQEIYLLATPTFDGTVTTVNLDQGLVQTFKSDFSNPTLEVTSGATRRVAVGALPSYFVAEAEAYDPIPRGNKTLRLEGDLSRTYVGGTVIYFSSGSAQDYNFVEGSSYNADTNRTEVTLGGGVLTQYSSPTTLYHSIRPILATPSANVSTTRVPVDATNVIVYRKVEGEPGVILVEGTDYTIDGSGVISLVNPLSPNEEVSAFYTGLISIEGGTTHRVSWNYALVPTVENGMLNQVLKMEYTTYIPDTFFWRVETLTNYRGELAQQFEDAAKATAPSQGPILENQGDQALYEKGRESLYYQERRLANEDLVARPTLKFYNDAINYLEDYLLHADGRVVGDRDGRFLFDGNLDNPVVDSFSQATNQIDDTIKIFNSPFPFLVPDVTVQAYEASKDSRFFPTSRRTPSRVAVTPTTTGEIFYDTGYKPISGLTSARKRFPFAMVTEFIPEGSTSLPVDDANGDDIFFRTAFENGMDIVILNDTGSVVDSLTISGAPTATSIPTGATSVDIPAGYTVLLDPADPYAENYSTNIVPINNDGQLAYLDLSLIFPTLPIPQADDNWDVVVGTVHDDTEPFRFPALDGAATDDDGDIQLDPLLSPQGKSEIANSISTGLPNGAGLNTREDDYIADIQANAAPNTRLTGSLDGLGTTLTLDSGTFAVTPREGDLVRVLTGLNGVTNWVRALSGTPTTISLETALTTDTGFDFLVTSVTSTTTGGGAGTSTTGTTFADTGENFITDGVLPGMTIVVTSGLNDRERRQVVSVDSATSLTIDTAFSSATSTFNYRIDNPLSTYGNAPHSSLTLWRDALTDLGDVLADEETALLDYINFVGTDVVVSANGSTNTSTLTDLTEDFETSQVALQDYVWIDSGPNFGFYEVTAVTDANNLEVTPDFPSVAAGVSYRIISTTGASLAGLEAVAAALANTQAALTSQATTLSLTDPVAVVNDADAYAHSVESSDLTARAAEVAARASELTNNDVPGISGVLASIDRLYDVRFTWIDGRINQETGILVRKQRAVKDRKKKLKQLIKNLTKLLTT